MKGSVNNNLIEELDKLDATITKLMLSAERRCCKKRTSIMVTDIAAVKSEDTILEYSNQESETRNKNQSSSSSSKRYNEPRIERRNQLHHGPTQNSIKKSNCTT
jgi:hypothetical protein